MAKIRSTIDSRTATRSNKAQIAEWIEDYGLDSDFVKVRVLGLPPSASELQFIDEAKVKAAQQPLRRGSPRKFLPRWTVKRKRPMNPSSNAVRQAP